MNKLKAYLPAIVIMMSLSLSLFVVNNNQLTYGGYKGLLMASIHNLEQAKGRQVEGDICITNGASNESLNLDLYYEGYIDKDDVLINGFVKIGEEVIDQPVIVYKKIDGISNLELNFLEEAIAMPLAELDTSLTVPGNKSFDYDMLYEKVMIEDLIIKDPRSGYFGLKIKVTCYVFDLSRDIPVEYDAIIEDLLGEVIDIQSLMVKVYVDGGANIIKMTVDAQGGTLTVEGDASLSKRRTR